MAAVALENELAVWSKVAQALGGQAGLGAAASANPISQNAFRALKLQMTTQKLSPSLQFIPFGEADVDAATGFAGPTGAFTLYAVWAKKSGTGTTAAYLQVRNNNTVTGAGESGALVSLRFKTSGDEAFQIFPTGLPYAQTTGSLIFSAVGIGGSTGTGPTTGDSDSQHGFLIIGA